MGVIWRARPGVERGLLRARPQNGRGRGRGSFSSSTRSRAFSSSSSPSSRSESAEDFIAKVCPQRDELSGVYRERVPEHRGGEGERETACVVLRGKGKEAMPPQVILPGEMFQVNVCVKQWEEAVEALGGGVDGVRGIVVTHEGHMSDIARGSKSVYARVRKAKRRDKSRLVLLELQAVERVVVASTRGLVTDDRPEDGQARLTLAKSLPLPDRWAYFVMLRSLEKQQAGEEGGSPATENALEDCKDALASLMEALDGTLRYCTEGRLERWTKARQWILGEGEDRVLQRCTRASFAGLLESSPETRARAMTTTDLGERLELAVKEVRRVGNVLKLKHNFEETTR
ncbi:hypothetical protein HOP50_01g09360 [Chloropicon primus]|nr:hypothetical protein HOP50_01g09360 [Chloropicon primus]|mmetsp:Transcript_30393/g.65048  ORF Transcript_30393/g.65048 Transcript_30393/m.65048 type:complete len:344 (+) Transcript_30393:145-1176(+)